MGIEQGNLRLGIGLKKPDDDDDDDDGAWGSWTGRARADDCARSDASSATYRNRC